MEGRHYCEDGRELEALHRRFWDEYEPAGPLEEMLVDQIVTAHWRLRRALTAEAGEISRSVDGGVRRRRRWLSPTLQWMRWTALGDPTHAMQESSIGCEILEDFLRNVRATVECERALTEEAVNKFAARFGGKPNSLTRSLDELRQKHEAEPDDPEAKPRKLAEVLSFLDKELNQLHRAKGFRADDEEQDDESRQAAAVLPSGEVLDKILRYETKLERQMYRAMTQLERVQRMRRGEAIPAPLSVEVTGGA